MYLHIPLPWTSPFRAKESSGGWLVTGKRVDNDEVEVIVDRLEEEKAQAFVAFLQGVHLLLPRLRTSPPPNFTELVDLLCLYPSNLAYHPPEGSVIRYDNLEWVVGEDSNETTLQVYPMHEGNVVEDVAVCLPSRQGPFRILRTKAREWTHVG